jgi:hypothetical protein
MTFPLVWQISSHDWGESSAKLPAANAVDDDDDDGADHRSAFRGHSGTGY